MTDLSVNQRVVITSGLHRELRGEIKRIITVDTDTPYLVYAVQTDDQNPVKWLLGSQLRPIMPPIFGPNSPVKIKGGINEGKIGHVTRVNNLPSGGYSYQICSFEPDYFVVGEYELEDSGPVLISDIIQALPRCPKCNSFTCNDWRKCPVCYFELRGERD